MLAPPARAAAAYSSTTGYAVFPIHYKPAFSRHEKGQVAYKLGLENKVFCCHWPDTQSDSITEYALSSFRSLWGSYQYVIMESLGKQDKHK